MIQGIETEKNIVVLYSNTNSHGRNDANGAFIPEAKKFSKLHAVPDKNRIGLNLMCSKKRRREKTFEAIESCYTKGNAVEAIALFGHGWPDGIQFGFDRKHINELSGFLAENCSPDCRIILFACLAAENDTRDLMHGNVGPGTDGGFADLLRDQMVREGFEKGHVDAHKTAGHTAWNPFLVRFLHNSVVDPVAGAIGGAWLVAPRSEHWSDWKTALKDEKSGLRWRFPFMSELQIKAELAGVVIP